MNMYSEMIGEVEKKLDLLEKDLFFQIKTPVLNDMKIFDSKGYIQNVNELSDLCIIYGSFNKEEDYVVAGNNLMNFCNNNYFDITADVEFDIELDLMLKNKRISKLENCVKKAIDDFSSFGDGVKYKSNGYLREISLLDNNLRIRPGFDSSNIIYAELKMKDKEKWRTNPDELKNFISVVENGMKNFEKMAEFHNSLEFGGGVSIKYFFKKRDMKKRKLFGVIESKAKVMGYKDVKHTTNLILGKHYAKLQRKRKKDLKKKSEIDSLIINGIMKNAKEQREKISGAKK